MSIPLRDFLRGGDPDSKDHGTSAEPMLQSEHNKDYKDYEETLPPLGASLKFLLDEIESSPKGRE